MVAPQTNKRKRVNEVGVKSKKIPIAVEESESDLEDVHFDEEEIHSDVASSKDDEEEMEQEVEREEDIIQSLVEDNQIELAEAQRQAKSYYKMPTADEIRSLKETEELFKSNLFKLQMDDLLKDISVNYEKCKGLEAMFWKLKTIFENMQDQPETDLNHIVSHLKKAYDIEIPFPNPQPHSESIKYTFGFRKPTNVRIVGSYLLQTVTKGRTGGLNADMMVEMPASLFQEKDFLNYRYFYKRAYYLCMLAAELKRQTATLGCEIKFSLLNGDQRKPIILLTSTGDVADLNFSSTKFSIRIIPSLAEDTFIPGRLSPGRNGIRSKSEGEKSLAPTPLYNNAILSETQYYRHLTYIHHWIRQSKELSDCSFVKAIHFIKVWLQRRGMDSSIYNGINGFLLTMIMAYLFNGPSTGSAKLSPRWSSYQLIRVTLDWIASVDIKSTPIVMTKANEVRDGFEVETFLKHFDVVILDPSGLVNLAADISLAEWSFLQHEARLAVEFMAQSSDKFDALFLMKVASPLYQFDNVCIVNDCPINPPLISAAKQLDFGTSPRAVVFAVESLMRKALHNRLSQFVIKCTPAKEWFVTEASPWLNSDQKTRLEIGMLLNQEHAARVVDQGPSADDKIASNEFRLIWGDKAELRRFKDGSITESVVWDHKKTNPESRFSIVEQALVYLLKRHLRLSSAAQKQIKYVGNQCNTLLSATRTCFKPQAHSFHPVMMAFELFTKQLKAVGESLPLTIVNVLPAHAALRHTSVVIPQPLVPSCKVTSYREPIEVNVSLESSGKWPKDLNAIQKTKASFYIQIADLFESAHPGSVCNIFRGEQTVMDEGGVSINAAGYIDITPSSGYIFRCRLYHNYELVLLEQKIVNPDTSAQMKEQFQAAYDLYEYQFTQKPLFTQYIQALTHTYPALSSTIRLIKRWFSSHGLLYSTSETDGELALLHHFPEEVLELMSVKAFVDSAPYSSPATPWSGFMRALKTFVFWNWKEEPFIVELQKGSLTPEVSNDIRKAFQTLRQQDPLGHRSSIYVVPLINPLMDSSSNEIDVGRLWQNSRWTRDVPSRVVLQRAQKLAMAALDTLEQELMSPIDRFMEIFQHPWKDYDLTVKLKTSMNTRRFESLFLSINDKMKNSKEAEPEFKNLKNETLNECLNSRFVLDATFDPVSAYLSDIKAIIGETGLIFYDSFGGDAIGIAFNPSFVQTPRPFKVNLGFNHMPIQEKSNTDEKSKKNKVFVKCNIASTVALIEAAGHGLVEKVQLHKRLHNN